MGTSYQRHSLFDMGNEGYTAMLEDKVIINDNIYQTIDFESEQSRKLLGVPTRVEDFTVFQLYLGGEADITSNFMKYTLRKNDIFIARSGDVGSFEGMSPDVKFILIFVSQDFFNPMKSIDSSQTLQDLLFRGPLHHCTDEQMQDFVNISELIRHQINSSNLYRINTIKNLLTALLFSIYSLTATEIAREVSIDQKNSTRQKDLFEGFMKLLKDNFAKQHKAAFYADKLCVTPKYLSQVVYKVSGKFIKDYIHEALITESMMLLNHGHTIQEICDRLEFASPSFFGRYFKEATGMTPMAYQNQI